jgi:glycosyltransferase involved in cell wall biosynthesis
MSLFKIKYLSVFHPYRGGIAQFNDLLAKELDKYFEVEKLNFKNQYPKILFPGKSQLVDEFDKIENASFIPYSPKAIVKSCRQINSSKFDFLITAYWMPFFAPSLAYLAKKLQSKVIKVAVLHNVIPHEPKFWDKYLNRYFLNNYDAFITLSETVSKQLLSLKPNAKYIQLYHPIYNQFGIELDKNKSKQKLNLPLDKPIILFFGFIRKYKGLAMLLQSFAKIQDKAHLVIAGESYEDFSIYENIIRDNFIESQNFTRIDGFISDENVQIIFSAADFLVLPYITATQSGISAIAHHFNLPILVNPVGELPNEIIHDFNGWVSENINEKSLIEGLIIMLTKYKDFRQNMKNHHTDKSWNNFGKKVHDFLTGLKH